MFLNVSNHPSNRWSETQIAAACEMTTDDFIMDEAFPSIDPNASTDEVCALAQGMVKALLQEESRSAIKLEGVMIQGEMTFVFAFVTAAKAVGIPCYAACTERKSKEIQNPDGSTTKTSVFEFVQFRKY